MIQHIQQLNQELLTAQNAEDFWSSCLASLTEYGIAGIGYGVLPFASDVLMNGISQAGFFKHSYPDDWASSIGEDDPVEHDISVDLICQGVDEIHWHDDEIVSDATEPQKRQFELENDIGMRFGVSMSLNKNQFGQSITGIGLWLNEVNQVESFHNFWRENGPVIRKLCFMLDEGLRGAQSELIVKLSNREKDCLTFLAIGMRPSEICWRLNISEKTLEKYVRSAKLKLKARTRDHAVAKAIVLNIINP